MTNSINKKKILLILFILIPVLLLIINLLIFTKGVHIRQFIPSTDNDEYGWWLQIQSLVKYNKPLGYFGYNEYHSPVGRMSSWPIFVHIPYVIIGKIIGWENYTMVWANVLLLTISLLIFVLLVKPSKIQTIFAIIIYVLGCQTTSYYSLLSMSECCRCSFGIMLVSFIIYLIRKRNVINKTGYHIYIYIYSFSVFYLSFLSIYRILFLYRSIFYQY